MSSPSHPDIAKRSDAALNRERILEAARRAFSDSSADVSMAEVARLAGVGRPTLYRNFADRRDLLEALYTAEVDELCAAAVPGSGESPRAALETWLRRFVGFVASKHRYGAELLQRTGSDNPVFGGSRERVLQAGWPLLEAARRSGEVGTDLGLDQILDLIVAVGSIDSDEAYVGPVREAVLRGILSPPGDHLASAHGG